MIDSGLVRQAGFDDANGFDTLRTVRISEASARQRAGRAGRTGPGRCIRVWSPQELLEPFDRPEIERLDLSSFALACSAWGWSDLESVRWISPPPSVRLYACAKLLKDLGAVEEKSGRLTSLGRVLSGLPVHPRLGKVLATSLRIGALRDGARLAALISERDFLSDDAVKRMSVRFGIHSDLLLRMDVLSGRISMEDAGCDREGLMRVRRVADQLFRELEKLSIRIPQGAVDGDHREEASCIGEQYDDEAHLAYLLLAGFSDRVCRRSKRGSKTAFMARGLGVRIAPISLERDSEYFLALDPRREENAAAGTEPIVRIAVGLRKEWLENWLSDRIVTEKSLSFDEMTGKAHWTFRKRLHALTLSEGESPVSSAEQAEVFAEWASRNGERWLRDVPSVNAWMTRYRIACRTLPETGWPEEPNWAEAARGWAAGCSSREQLKGRPALSWVQSTLPGEAIRLVEDELPESLTLPNGRSVRIDYDIETGQPIIAARVQDFFGWRATPRLLQGRLAILLEILAPNQRPVQRTLDLESFWRNTYPQVRKDLRGRYPKHHWPEDPWTATAGPSVRRQKES